MIETTNECNEEATEETVVIRTAKISECASMCKSVSPIFAYGTNDFGGQGCNNGLCKCHCIDEMNDDLCKKINFKDYWFLKAEENFQKDGKLL